MGTNSQSRVPPLAARGGLGFHDQKTEDTRIIAESGLHRLEEERGCYIAIGTTKATDHPATTAAAAVGNEAAIEATIKAVTEAVAQEGSGHRIMEAHSVEK